LVRNGTALTPARMAALTRVATPYFERALEFFCRPDVAWLEHIEWPGDSPGEIPQAPKTGVARETAGTISPREREERDKREKGERALTGGSPTVEEVRAWATAQSIDPDFAAEKHRQHTTRHGWRVHGRLIDWQSRWLDYWQQEGEAWSATRKKHVRGANGRPVGWQAGDAEVWWTDSLADVRAATSGAALGGDEKTVARLRAILALRDKEAR
jgi:hypothetical protein